MTEVDVLAVRFPHSHEFDDDKLLKIPEDSIDVVFAEAKAKHIESLNGPWSSPEKGALDYVLRRVGVIPEERVVDLAHKLYSRRRAIAEGVRLRVACFGKSISKTLRAEGVTFVPWNHVLDFVHSRFRNNEQLKADHEAWDEFGQYLWGRLSVPQVPDANEFFDGWEKRQRIR